MNAHPRHDVPQDSAEIARLSEMVVALLGELTIVTERLDTVERLLDEAKVVRRADIETYQPDERAQAERGRRRTRQIEKVFRPLRAAAERAAQALASLNTGEKS